jgi:heme/copper-type cytochrome/quinol oxidase subunit 2
MPRVLPALALTAALTAPLAGLSACGSSAPSSGAASAAPSTASSSVPTASPEQTTSAGSPAAPQAGAAQVIALTVTGGKVSGATGRVRVELGSTVRLQVTADVTEEVHVHGYDLMKDTVPGQPVTIEFTADVPGVFEVELEESKLPLTRLQVQ